MPAKKTVSKKDIEKRTKRVNLTLSIEEFDKLNLIAEFRGMEHTSIAKMMLIPEINKEATRILKVEKYVPKSQRGLKFL
jgi:hypothetical protein